ncbi:PaaI family thioesterase [Brevundimonas diminuta]|uniref:PaaI family thioesterase n=1 Tax=Brevundimonas diminuta TaxID=293 RepID=UPI0028A13294|nr:PaaI family thioesterase [Brevundimonas diminuta]
MTITLDTRMPPDLIAPCRGCQISNTPCRFGADDFIALSETVARVRLTCPAAFEGGPRVAHGGWTAAVFDDVLGRFLTHTGLRSVTATLTVDYLLPVPVEQPLELHLEIASREGRRNHLTGALRLQGSDRDLALARGVWVELRPGHFERHQARMTEFGIYRGKHAIAPCGPGREDGL